jgi:Type II secretory pathway, component PulD
LADLATAIPSGLKLVIDKTGRFKATLRALADKSRVTILSSPHIIASDNKEAEIDVTQEIPITSGTVTTSSAEPLITQTTEYRDTGIILRVTPHINDNGLVTLDISQEVSELSSETVPGNDNPVFLKRAALTSMVVQNGQTVIIGGLIRQNWNRDKQGVPYLSRIPFFGGLLFGYQDKDSQRSELMLLLTPHVITNIQEADLITREFQEKLNILKNPTEGQAPETEIGQPLGNVNER